MQILADQNNSARNEEFVAEANLIKQPTLFLKYLTRVSEA